MATPFALPNRYGNLAYCEICRVLFFASSCLYPFPGHSHKHTPFQTCPLRISIFDSKCSHSDDWSTYAFVAGFCHIIRIYSIRSRLPPHHFTSFPKPFRMRAQFCTTIFNNIISLVAVCWEIRIHILACHIHTVAYLDVVRLRRPNAFKWRGVRTANVLASDLALKGLRFWRTLCHVDTSEYQHRATRGGTWRLKYSVRKPYAKRQQL